VRSAEIIRRCESKTSCGYETDRGLGKNSASDILADGSFWSQLSPSHKLHQERVSSSLTIHRILVVLTSTKVFLAPPRISVALAYEAKNFS
jgi:hypothetical protein